jgi:hypothetical protein
MYNLERPKRYCICQQELMIDNSGNYVNVCKKCLEKIRKSRL